MPRRSPVPALSQPTAATAPVRSAAAAEEGASRLLPEQTCSPATSPRRAAAARIGAGREPFICKPAAPRRNCCWTTPARAGAITPLQAAQGANLIVQNSAVGLANSSLSFGSLLVGSNAWLMASNANASQTLNLTVSGNATIQPGGGLIADGGGYTANNGPGRGNYYCVPAEIIRAAAAAMAVTAPPGRAPIIPAAALLTTRLSRPTPPAAAAADIRLTPSAATAAGRL